MNPNEKRRRIVLKKIASRAAIAAILLTVSLGAFCWTSRKDRKEARALCKEVSAAYNLRSAGAKLFRLKAKYEGYAKDHKIVSGTLVLYWKSPDSWRKEVSVGKATRIIVRHGDQEGIVDHGTWTQADDDVLVKVLEPLSISWWLDLPKGKPDGVMPRKMDNGDRELDCSVSMGERCWIHLDRDKRRLLAISTASGRKWSYVSRIWGGHLLPSIIRETVNGSGVSQWRLLNISDLGKTEEPLLSIPAKAFIYGSDDGGGDFRLIEGGYPLYPKTLVGKDKKKNVSASMQIERDGRVRHLTIHGKDKNPFSKAVRKTLGYWRFQFPPYAQRGPILWTLTARFEPDRVAERTSVEDRKEAAVLYQKVANSYNLRESGSKPFRLKVHYESTGEGGNSMEGTLVLAWDSPESWREEIVTSGADRVLIRSGDRIARILKGEWTLADADLASSLEKGLDVLNRQDFFRSDPIKVFRRTLKDGRKVVDVSWGEKDSPVFFRIRLDPETGELLETNRGADAKTTYQSKKIGNMWVPSGIHYFRKGEERARWTLSSFNYIQHTEAVPFKIPRGSATWPACDDTTGYPKVVKPEAPKYPHSVAWKGHGGEVVIKIQIGSTGKVLSQEIVESSRRVFDKASLKTAKEFKYRLLPCQQARAPLTRFLTFKFGTGPELLVGVVHK